MVIRADPVHGRAALTLQFPAEQIAGGRWGAAQPDFGFDASAGEGA